MKKILFVINNLEIGGVQTSLLNLLKEIETHYDITVLSFYCKPEYKSYLPNGVKLISARSPFKYLGMSQAVAKRHPVHFLCRSAWAVLTKLFGRSITIKLMSPFQPKIKGYDVVVSYLHEGGQRIFYGGCNEFVLSKTDADKKITWLHCDFGRCGANNNKSRKLYKKFDNIVACSDGTKNAFVQYMPELKDKCVTIRNCNDYEMIRARASSPVTYGENRFNIVTVARLAYEKGIDRAINAVKRCLDDGYDIAYHIVGGGEQESVLKGTVKELGISDNVFFYGNQQNPYPYIAPADLFLLPSYHEAAPMVFDEAACLGVPVLATETTSTYEMILQSGHGYVCENDDNAIYEKLKWILENKDELVSVKNILQKKTFSNTMSAEGFGVLLG